MITRIFGVVTGGRLNLRAGQCDSNKLIVIFSKMTLLATTSSSMEKKISKQGFRMPKFRMPVDAVTFSLGMWWISGIALPHSLLSAVPEKIFSICFKSCRKMVFSLQFKSEGNINFPSHERKGGNHQKWNARICCYVSTKRLTIQDEMISNRLIKNFSCFLWIA